MPRREMGRSLTTAVLATTRVVETVEILLAWWHPRRGADVRLLPSHKIRLGTNGETSRVSTPKFTASRHENRSCKYMEDMYSDNDYIT